MNLLRGGTVCRYCGNAGATIATFSYWNHDEFLCHPECKSAGEKAEAIDCQTIDADCNDCRFFQRGSLAPKITSLLRKPNGKIESVSHQPQFFFGFCLKFQIPTIGQPNKWTGKDCFAHRRSSL